MYRHGLLCKLICTLICVSYLQARLLRACVCSIAYCVLCVTTSERVLGDLMHKLAYTLNVNEILYGLPKSYLDRVDSSITARNVKSSTDENRT